MVVETMKKEHLNIYATMQEFGINDHKIIERWERIYLEEGPEGLSVERRGRSSTGPPHLLDSMIYYLTSGVLFNCGCFGNIYI